MRFRPGWPGMALVFIANTLSSVAAGSDGARRLVERTMAFIGTRPVLLSEVELTKALLPLQGGEALEHTIDEALMFDEASRLVSAAPSPEQIEAAFRVLRERAGMTFPDAAIRRKALTQVTISTYIELRLRPLVRVEDGDVRRAFNERIARDPLTPTPGFAAVAESLREALERQALDQKIEEWVASLRQVKTVRRLPERPR